MRKEEGQMKKAYVQAGQQARKVVSKKLRKRYSVPLWLLLVLIGIPVFCDRFPDPGSYYDRQTVVKPIVQASGHTPLGAAATEPGPIAGIDVSEWQGSIDWKAVKESGVKFVIVKATESSTQVDPYFVTNWEGAKAAGLLVSAYHVVQPHRSAMTQAKHFLDTIGDRQPDFPLALDVELRGVGNIGAIVEEIALMVEASDGRKPLMYTAQSFWGANVGWAPGWSAYALWVADYDAVVPAIPTGWDSYTIWQHSSTGSVLGIQGNVDLNVFVGGLQDLSNLGR